MALAPAGPSAPVAAVVLALVLVQIGFGAYGIVVQKFAKGAGVDALVFSLCRDAFALPVLLLAAVLVERRVVLPRARDIPIFFALGLTGMFGNQFLYIQGLFYTTPNVASVLQPCIPVFTALLAFLVCIEPLPSSARKHQWFKILGILLGTGGAVLMVLTRPGSAHHDAVVSLYQGPACASGPTFLNTTHYASGACEPHFDHFAFAKVECDTSNANITVTSCADKTCSACTGPKTVFASGSCVQGFDESRYLSALLTCEDEKPKNQILGTAFLIGNCLCMSVYILIQKKFIFAVDEDGEKISRWGDYPIHTTAYR
jgi:drug/metabolite transporter (DMT)-like permease